MTTNSLDPAALSRAFSPKLWGCFTGGAQAEMRLNLDIDEFDLPVSLAQLDAWLDHAFGAQPPWADFSHPTPALPVLSRALGLAHELMRAAQIPVFDTGRIVSVQARDSETVKRWRIGVRVPVIDHLPTPLLVSAYQVAMKLLLSAATQMAQGLTPDTAKARTMAHQLIIQKLQSAIPTGISTVPILRAAWQKSVPFRHTGGGVFQLGWGAQSRRMHRSSVDQDSAIGSAVAHWKTHTNLLLSALGLPCPAHVLVKNVAEAQVAARRLGWPVVIKPANCERSEGVNIHIADEVAVQEAFEYALKFSKFILVEKQVPGICHRLMITNGRFLYALWRKPLSVMGNGVNDVAGLMSSLQATAEASPPWARDKVVPLDDLTRQVLTSQGMTEHTVPAPGQRVLLRFLESTEWGEDRGDATATTHPENVKLAERAARAMGLSNVGVDIISPDISVPWFENGAMVNEVNYAPHFGATEVARSHMPEFIRDLIDGDGRIPIVVFLGQSAARRAAKSQQAQWRASGLRGWFTSASETRDDEGQQVPMACEGSFAKTLALLGDPQVQALAIVLDDASWALSGAPVDRIEAWHDLREGPLSEAKSGPLVRLLNDLSPKLN